MNKFHIFQNILNICLNVKSKLRVGGLRLNRNADFSDLCFCLYTMIGFMKTDTGRFRLVLTVIGGIYASVYTQTIVGFILESIR